MMHKGGFLGECLGGGEGRWWMNVDECKLVKSAIECLVLITALNHFLIWFSKPFGLFGRGDSNANKMKA